MHYDDTEKHEKWGAPAVLRSPLQKSEGARTPSAPASDAYGLPPSLSPIPPFLSPSIFLLDPQYAIWKNTYGWGKNLADIRISRIFAYVKKFGQDSAEYKNFAV